MKKDTKIQIKEKELKEKIKKDKTYKNNKNENKGKCESMIEKCIIKKLKNENIYKINTLNKNHKKIYFYAFKSI